MFCFEKKCCLSLRSNPSVRCCHINIFLSTLEQQEHTRRQQCDLSFFMFHVMSHYSHELWQWREIIQPRGPFLGGGWGGCNSLNVTGASVPLKIRTLILTNRYPDFICVLAVVFFSLFFRLCFSFLSDYRAGIIILDSYCLHLLVQSYCTPLFFFFLCVWVAGVSRERPLLILGLLSAGGR